MMLNLIWIINVNKTVLLKTEYQIIFDLQF
jgi:hypothetical protein